MELKPLHTRLQEKDARDENSTSGYDRLGHGIYRE